MRVLFLAAILVSSPAAADLYMVKAPPTAQFRSDVARVTIAGSGPSKSPTEPTKTAGMIIDCQGGKLKIILGGANLAGVQDSTGSVTVAGRTKSASLAAQLVSDRGTSVLVMTLDKPDQIQSLYSAMVDQADNMSKVQLDFLDSAKPDQKPEVFYFSFRANDDGYAALFAKQLDVVRGACVR